MRVSVCILCPTRVSAYLFMLSFGNTIEFRQIVRIRGAAFCDITKSEFECMNLRIFGCDLVGKLEEKNAFC